MLPVRAARLLFQLPRNCRIYTTLSPPNEWGWSEILNNKIVYLLEVLVWQKTKDAQKKAPRHRPKPFKPDFMKLETKKQGAAKDSEAHTVDDIKAILALPRG